MANSISARQRWSINHGVRCTLIAAALEECGLQNKQDVTNDLLPHRIQKSKAQMDCFISHLKSRMNPFSVNVRKDALFQIATGQSSPQEVEDFLLNIENIGKKMREQMIQNCSENEKNFEKYVIKKN